MSDSETQQRDGRGNIIRTANQPILITSSTTTSIFTGVGTLLAVQIGTDVDGGTYYFTDQDDDPITGIYSVTAKTVTDFAGTFAFVGIPLTNGLKVVTENTTGIRMIVFTFNG